MKKTLTQTQRDELLVRLDERVDGLLTRLYGEEHDEGDIPTLCGLVKEQNGKVCTLATRVNILWGVALIIAGGTGFSIFRLFI